MYIDVDIVDHVDTKIIDTVGIANIVDIVNNVDNIDIVATLIGKILWVLYEKICGIFLLKRKVEFILQIFLLCLLGLMFCVRTVSLHYIQRQTLS